MRKLLATSIALMQLLLLNTVPVPGGDKGWDHTKGLKAAAEEKSSHVRPELHKGYTSPASLSSKTTNQEVIYSENFETGAPGWKFQDLWSEASWHTSTTGALSGKSYWCGIEELGGYDDQWLQTLTSPAITLPTSSNLSLSLMHNYSIEDTLGSFGSFPIGYDAWDAINVRLSTDGANFVVIEPVGGYTANNADGFYSYYGEGAPGWFGSTNGWVSATFDLTPFSGQTVWIRFEFGSDTGFSSAQDPSLFGWRVDDIKINDGATVIFSDDAGDSSPAQFVAGGPGGPLLWHFTSEVASSPLTSVAGFDQSTGNYQPQMQAAIVSPAIALDNLPESTLRLAADFQIRGTVDATENATFCFPDGYCWRDFLQVEVHAFRDGVWGYWDFVGVAESFGAPDFISYNTINQHGSDLEFEIIGADSVQYRIYLSTVADGTVIPLAKVHVDDFTLTALVATSVNDRPGNELPAEFALGNNYPNPFNPQTTIEFALAEAGKVTLTIYNALGEEVGELIDTEMPAGLHHVVWEARNHASGVYFYRLTAKNFSEVKKMVLMR